MRLKHGALCCRNDSSMRAIRMDLCFRADERHVLVRGCCGANKELAPSFAGGHGLKRELSYIQDHVILPKCEETA